MPYIYVIVGVGGTGSLLARDLPKLLLNTDDKMLIVDGDDVEEKNMIRQSYQRHDIGEKKADALSKKINTFFGDICDSLPLYLTNNELFSYISESWRGYEPIIIGCVDNDQTRKLLEKAAVSFNRCIYLDSANSEYEGNIYAFQKNVIENTGALRSETYKLSDDFLPTDKSCEHQISKGNTQYLVTNSAMANALLEHVDYIKHNRQAKIGVTHVKRFEKIHYS